MALSRFGQFASQIGSGYDQWAKENGSDYDKVNKLKAEHYDDFKMPIIGGDFTQSVYNSALGVVGGVADELGNPYGIGDSINRYVQGSELTMGEKPEASLSWDYIKRGLARDTGNVIGSMIPMGIAALGAGALAPTLGLGAVGATALAGLTSAGVEAMSEGGNKLRESLENGDDLETAQAKAREVTAKNAGMLGILNSLGIGAGKKAIKGIKNAAMGARGVNNVAKTVADIPTSTPSSFAGVAKTAGLTGFEAANEGVQEAIQTGISASVEPDKYYSYNPLYFSDEQQKAFNSTIGPMMLLGGLGGGARFTANKIGEYRNPADKLDEYTDNAKAENEQNNTGFVVPETANYTIADEVSDPNLKQTTEMKLRLLDDAYFKQYGQHLYVTSMTRHWGTNSNHETGSAFDVADSELENDAERRQWLANTAQQIGLTPLDEYENPSDGATGGHLHFSDHGEAINGATNGVFSNAPIAWSGNDEINNLIYANATKYGLDPALLAAVAEQESGFNQDAVSEAGARGVMQLMPSTAEGLGVDPDDVAGNIEGGAKYLRQLLDQFDGDVSTALEAYNGGANGIGQEATRKYASEVMARYQNNQNKRGGSFSWDGKNDIPTATVTDVDYMKIMSDNNNTADTANDFLHMVSLFADDSEQGRKDKALADRAIAEDNEAETEKTARELGYRTEGETESTAEGESNMPMDKIKSHVASTGRVEFGSKANADEFGQSDFGKGMYRVSDTGFVAPHYNAVTGRVEDRSANDKATSKNAPNAPQTPLTRNEMDMLNSSIARMSPKDIADVNTAISQGNYDSVRDVLRQVNPETALNGSTLNEAKDILRALRDDVNAMEAERVANVMTGNDAGERKISRVDNAKIDMALNGNNLDAINRLNQFMGQNLLRNGISPVDWLEQHRGKAPEVSTENLPMEAGTPTDGTMGEKLNNLSEGLNNVANNLLGNNNVGENTVAENGRTTENVETASPTDVTSDILKSDVFKAQLTPAERAFVEYIDKLFTDTGRGFKATLDRLYKLRSKVYDERMNMLRQQGLKDERFKNMPPKVWEAWKYLKNPSINEVVRGGYMAMKNANGRPPKADVVAKIEKCNNVLDKYLDPFVKEDCSHNERYRNVESAISGLKGISEKATEFERLRTAEGRQGSELRNKPLSREQQAEVDARATELGQALYNEQNGIQTEAPQTDTSVDNVPSQTDSEAPTEGSAPQVDTAPTEVNTAEGEQTGEAQDNGNTDNAPASEPENKNTTDTSVSGDNIELEDGYTTESGKSIGEADRKDFIVKPDGNKDFGNISKEIEDKTNGVVKSAPIRLQVGDSNFGYIHLLKHSEQMKKKGYSVMDYLIHTLENFTQIYSQQTEKKPNRFVLYCTDETRGFMPIDLEFAMGDDGYYTIVSAMPHNPKIKGTLLFDGSAIPSTATTNGTLLDGTNDNGGVEAPPNTHGKSNVPTSDTSVSQGQENGKQILDGDTAKVITDNGKKEYNIQYRIVPAGDVVASHVADGSFRTNDNYPSERQPRNRQRAALQNQVIAMSNSLRPADLGASRNLNNGAPVVTADNVVLNGNGRTIAVQMAFANDKGNEYHQYLIDHADEFGLSREDVLKMENPMLVRVVTDELTDADIDGIINSTAGGQRMSPSEQAKADAKNIKTSSLKKYVETENGALDTPANREFVGSVLNDILNANESNAYLTADGGINKDGLLRVQRALFALAYGDGGLLDGFSENLNEDAKNFTRMLSTNAPILAGLQKRIADGNAYDIGLTKEVGEAVRLLRQAIKENKPARSIWEQTSLLDEYAPSEDTISIVKALDKYRRSGKKLTQFLSNLAQENANMGNPKQTELFEGIPKLTLAEAITNAEKKMQEQSKTDIANAKELNRRLKLDEEGQKAYDFLYKKFKNSKHIDMDDNIVQALAKMVAFHAQSMASVQRAYGLENYSALGYAKRLEIEFSGRGAKSSKRGTNQEEYNRAAQRIINKILIRKIAPDETQYDKAGTVLHEFGHYFLSDLYNITHSPRGKCPAQLKEDYGKLVEWLGGDKHHPIDEMWRSRKYNEEKLARAFEKYFAEGKAPTEELQSAFDKIIGGLKKALEKVKAMLEEYAGTSWAKKYAIPEIPAEIQDIMDRMFTYDATGADMASITYKITSDRVGRTTYRYNEENRPTEKSIDRSERNVDNGEKGFTPITNQGEYEKSKSAIAKSMWGTDGYYFPERQRAEMFADVRSDIGSDELQKKLESARGQEDIDRIREQSPVIKDLNQRFNAAKGINKGHFAVKLQYAREVFEHEPRVIQARNSTAGRFVNDINGQGRIDTSTESAIGKAVGGERYTGSIGEQQTQNGKTSKNASTGGIVVAGEYDASAQLYDKLYNEHKLKHPKLAEKDLQDSSAFSNGKNSRSSEVEAVDTEYMQTVDEYQNATTENDKNTALEKLRAMVQRVAEKAGFSNAIPEQTRAYTVRTKSAPKKTMKVYKVFTVDENGRPSALFVSSKDTLPQNVWLDANDTTYFVDTKNGRKYIPSTKNPNTKGGATGEARETANISKEDLARLEEQGYIKRDKNGAYPKTITALAYRPGWHAGDLPFFPQGGKRGDGSTNYKNIHRYNQVVFECEIAYDNDYTQTSKNAKGETVFHDRQEMPVDGGYKFATNPMAHAEDIGSWYISGSLKIGRALTEEECNRILAEKGYKPQEWQEYGAGNKFAIGSLDLARLGYTGEEYDAARKTLAPITYDDNGNVIPLSERFNIDIDDVRYSAENRLPNPNSASTLKQDGNTETALDKLPKIPREKLRESERKIQDFGNQIGVPVHFVEHSDKGYRGQFRGVSNHNGEIYINRSASVPAKAIFLHEFTHWLKASGAENKAVYDALAACVETVNGRIDPAKLDGYRKRIYGGEEMTTEEIVEEIISDAMGNSKSAESILKAIDRMNPDMNKSLWGKIKALWDKFCKSVGFRQEIMPSLQKGKLPNGLNADEMARFNTTLNNQLLKIRDSEGKPVFKLDGYKLKVADGKSVEESFNTDPVSEYADYANSSEKSVDSNVKYSRSTEEQLDEGITPSTDEQAIFRGATQKLLNRFSGKRDNTPDNLTIKNRETKEEVDIIDYFWKSPVRLARAFPAVANFVMSAKSATERQERYRAEFNEGMNDIMSLLGYKNFGRNDSNYKANRENLQKVLLAGDLEGVQYTADELKKQGMNEQVIKAYMKMRQLLDKAYKLANDTKGRIKYGTERFRSEAEIETWLKAKHTENPFVSVVKRTNQTDGTILVDYKEPKAYKSSAETMTAEDLANLKKDKNVSIERETELKDGLYKVTYWQKNAEMSKLQGYIPHIFHGWLVMETDENGKVLRDENDNPVILETYNSMAEATKAGEKLAEGNKTRHFMVAPQLNEFDGASERATIMGDYAYSKVMSKVSQGMQMSIADAKKFMEGTVATQGRGRFLGYTLHRKGVSGYEQNVYRATAMYFNQVSRFAALDQFKRDSINNYEHTFGAWGDSRITDASRTAKWVREYVNDVNGVPNYWERAINDFLHTMGLGKEVANGRPAIWLQHAMMYPMTIAKLGVLNVSSALLNFTQLFNVAGAMGKIPEQKILGGAIRDTVKAMSNKDSEIGKLLWKDLGLKYQIGIDVASGYSRAEVGTMAELGGAVGKLAGQSMYFFRQSDAFARGVTLLTAYNTALKDGKSKADAVRYAKEVNDKVNFDYSVADAPRMFRALGPVGAVLLQFQKYPVKQIELFSDILTNNGERGIIKSLTSPKAMANFLKFTSPYVAFSGMMGIPFSGLIGGLVSAMVAAGTGDDDWDWEQKTKQHLMDKFGEDNPLVQWWCYGIASSIGINVASRVGVGDFMAVDNQSKTTADRIMGATTMGSTLYQTAKQIGYGNYAEAVRAISPAVGNILIANKGNIKTTRGRMKYKYQSDYERLVRALGFTPLNETLAGDLASNEYAERNAMTIEKERAVDDFMENPSVENAERLNELGVTPKTLKNEMARRTMNRHEINEMEAEKKAERAKKKKTKEKSYSSKEYRESLK